MSQLSPTLRRYLIAIWTISLATWISSWFLRFDHRPLSWPLLGALLGLLVLTQSLPQHILRGTKITLSTVPLFVAALSLPVSAAVSIALAGVALAQGRRRRPWYELSFNVASAGLEVYVGGVIWALLALIPGAWAAPAATLLCAAALYVINVSAVAGAVAAQHRLTYRHVWHQIATAEMLDHGLMFLVGGLLVLPLVWKPLAAALMLAGIATRLILRVRREDWVLRKQQI
jgi:hypothetical protein